MSTEPTSADRKYALARGHEERDVYFRPIVIATIILVATLVLAAVGMRVLLFHFLDRDARLSPPANPLAAAAGPRLPPEPRLLPKPVEQLRALRAEEDETLSTYGWTDRANGVVRIPIDRAMDLVVERGLPEVEPAPDAAPEESAGQEAEMPKAGADAP